MTTTPAQTDFSNPKNASLWYSLSEEEQMLIIRAENLERRAGAAPWTLPEARELRTKVAEAHNW
jgi:hypothetical protein